MRSDLVKRLYPFLNQREAKERLRHREIQRGIKPMGYILDGRLSRPFYSSVDAARLRQELRRGPKQKEQTNDVW